MNFYNAFRKTCWIAVFFAALHASAFAQTSYYVSQFGDNGNTGLMGSPFRDVQVALNACVPGDTVIIYGGAYYEFLTVPEDHITIKKEWPLDEVWINAPFNTDGTGMALLLIEGKSNIHIDGLTFSFHAANYAKGVYVRGNSDNIIIENCNFNNIHFSPNSSAPVNENTNAQPLIVEGTSEDPIENLIIRNCTIEDCRLGYSEALALNGNVDSFVIEGNRLDQLSNIGIVAIGHEGTCSNPLLDQARNGVIRGNWVSSCLSQYATSGGIYVDGGKDIFIEQNYCNHNGYGIEIGCEHPGKSASNVVVKNNILQDNQVTGLAVGGYDFPNMSGTVSQVLVRNNTFYKNDYINDFTGEFLITHCNNLDMHNNIFFLNNQGILGYSENDGGNNQVRYNVVWNPLGSMELTWFGETAESFSELSTVLGWSEPGVWGNPLFVSAQQENFRIQPNSAARDYSLPETGVEDGELDYYGENRLNGILDSGAAEETTIINVEENEPNEYSVFPNPAVDKIYVKGITSRSSVIVYNLSGEIVKEKVLFKDEPLGIQDLSRGIYFLRIGEECHLFSKF